MCAYCAVTWANRPTDSAAVQRSSGLADVSDEVTRVRVAAINSAPANASFASAKPFRPASIAAKMFIYKKKSSLKEEWTSFRFRER